MKTIKCVSTLCMLWLVSMGAAAEVIKGNIIISFILKDTIP